MITEHNWSTEIHPELLEVKNYVYDRCSFNCTVPIPEAESKEYGAYTFCANEKQIIYRVAKITPTKTGQFVTLWKRNKSGTIEPFDSSDNLDLIVISVRKDKYCGQFVFPKNVLEEKRIVTSNSIEGKRAIRVYPPWDKDLNKQAHKTQQWQLDYFLDLSSNLDIERAKHLYGVLS